jgi:hypothetical protein
MACSVLSVHGAGKRSAYAAFARPDRNIETSLSGLLNLYTAMEELLLKPPLFAELIFPTHVHTSSFQNLLIVLSTIILKASSTWYSNVGRNTFLQRVCFLSSLQTCHGPPLHLLRQGCRRSATKPRKPFWVQGETKIIQKVESSHTKDSGNITSHRDHGCEHHFRRSRCFTLLATLVRPC